VIVGTTDAFRSAPKKDRPTPGILLSVLEFPRGSFVFLPQYAIHRHPAYWADPTRFDPDRFGPGPHLTPDGSPRPRGAYFPFGDGQRKCIGRGARLPLQLGVRQKRE
jgi:cytochrome P450